MQPEPVPAQPEPVPAQPEPVPAQPEPVPVQPEPAPVQPEPAPFQPEPEQPEPEQPMPEQQKLEKQALSRNFIHVNILLTPTMPKRSSTFGYGLSLQYLELTNTCLTREGFSDLLRYSPILHKLKLLNVLVLSYNPAFELFKDSSVTSLEASLNKILVPDTELTSSPSLLVHFPQLKEWHVTSLERASTWTNDALRSEISTYCPLLKRFQFGQCESGMLSDLLLYCTQDLESCTFSAKNLLISTAFACISHQRTLTSLTLIGQQDSQTDQWVYFIPKLCPNLKVLSMEGVTLDIKLIENQPWTCMDLQELRVRFEGLDGGDGIAQCVTRVSAWRQAGASTPFRVLENGTVVSRVSVHLAQFYQLSKLWSGSKEYYLPLSPSV
jgi:hypothetical protein